MSFVYWLNKIKDEVRTLGIDSSICDSSPGETSYGTSIFAVCVDEKIQVPSPNVLGQSIRLHPQSKSLHSQEEGPVLPRVPVYQPRAPAAEFWRDREGLGLVVGR